MPCCHWDRCHCWHHLQRFYDVRMEIGAQGKDRFHFWHAQGAPEEEEAVCRPIQRKSILPIIFDEIAKLARKWENLRFGWTSKKCAKANDTGAFHRTRRWSRGICLRGWSRIDDGTVSGDKSIKRGTTVIANKLFCLRSCRKIFGISIQVLSQCPMKTLLLLLTIIWWSKHLFVLLRSLLISFQRVEARPTQCELFKLENVFLKFFAIAILIVAIIDAKRRATIWNTSRDVIALAWATDYAVRKWNILIGVPSFLLAIGKVRLEGKARIGQKIAAYKSKY